MDSMSGFDIRLVCTFPPKDWSTKNAYTSEITSLALVPWMYLWWSVHNITGVFILQQFLCAVTLHPHIPYEKEHPPIIIYLY